jgi:hypothetical protein
MLTLGAHLFAKKLINSLGLHGNLTKMHSLTLMNMFLLKKQKQKTLDTHEFARKKQGHDIETNSFVGIRTLQHGNKFFSSHKWSRMRHSDPFQPPPLPSSSSSNKKTPQQGK